MAIRERLLELRFPLLLAGLAVAAVLSLLHLGPSFATVVQFFWPLLLSTGFFLAAIAILLRISPPPPAEASVERAGEDLIGYVAGHPPVTGEAVEEHTRGEDEGAPREADVEEEEEEEEEEEQQQRDNHHQKKSL